MKKINNIMIQTSTERTREITELLFVLHNDKLFNVTWNAVSDSDGLIFGNNVRINEELPDESMLNYICFAELSSIIYDNKWFGSCSKIDFEIKSIIFQFSDSSYTVFDSGLSAFQKISIPVNGSTKKMTLQEYNDIAKFVRQKDRADNLLCAIESHDEGNIMGNIKRFIMENIDEATSVFSKVEDYSGEEELEAINSVLADAGGASVYECVLKSGEKSYPLLMDCEIDRIRKQEIPVIYTDRGESIKTEDIEKILFYDTYNL